MKLSELERAVLGPIWRRQPCTAYSVQKNFSLVSMGWSSSPGSVYPVIRKLERRGLVSSQSHKKGQKSVCLYSLTEAGVEQLRNWILEIPEWIGRPPADPSRTRAFYLDILASDDDRLDFIARVAAETGKAVRRLQAGIDSVPGADWATERQAQVGAIYMLEARLRWLEELGRHFT